VLRVRRVIAITDRSKNKFAIGWLAYGNPPLKSSAERLKNRLPAHNFRFEPCLRRTRTGLSCRRAGNSDIENRLAEIQGQKWLIRAVDMPGSAAETRLVPANPRTTQRIFNALNFR
jgi:hypothetical protein